MTSRAAVAWGLAASLAAACARAPMNAPLARPLGADELNRERPLPAGRCEEVAVVVALSGGGARAAALGYGVLEELAATRVEGPDGAHRLLDDVSLITSVSGGSFTAAYYGVHGDRLFTDFERDFLKAGIGTRLWLRLLNPVNWVRLASPAFAVSDLAAELYDDALFHGATLGDVNATPGPLIAIQATDVVGGNRFGFAAHTFALICSDVARYPVARAVAASAAFPIVFSPIVLENHAERCAHPEPAWIAETLAEGPAAGRRYRAARSLHAYADARARPRVHLVDGGVADNLGLHRVFDAVAARRGAAELLRQRGLPKARRVAFIVVNAQTDPESRWGAGDATPDLLTMLDVVTSVQVARYNYESVDLLRRSIADWSKERTASGPLEGFVIEVGFDQIADEGERRALSGLPTAFDLPEADVDRLREAGRRLLRASPDFQRLLASLRELTRAERGR